VPVIKTLMLAAIIFGLFESAAWAALERATSHFGIDQYALRISLPYKSHR
jgi:hypothetical protein